MATKAVTVGVDGSEESLRAVEWAALEARRHGSPLRIVSAPAELPRMHAYHASPAEIGAALRGISARALDAAIIRSEEVAPGLPIDTGLLSGSPAVAVADSGADASMLVVGARGAGGFAAMMLGSVSRYVAAWASCPVVVVREETTAVHREIAVGVRDPEDVTGTLAFAFEEAALRGADLVAVHTWYWLPTALPPSGPAGALMPPDPAQISAEAGRHLAAALEQWHGKYPEVRVRQDIVRGHPARVLASYSARADLVVIGRHGHPVGPGPGIGSIQHAVLDHAHGPVAVVPSGD
ncbi:MAG TPA: universal stress protein [Streptosporangiaceae bacterium]|nr:universal stress protein [Streptosporangiaceae bacterium]